ncbi:MAG: discoidin domain-containing protein [Phycisphaerae bacterium]|nr:discoidin domain-containing protein [Phycisphaerae bacterium]
MAAVLCPYSVASNDPEQGFYSPPDSAGIRAFWWWLNGNVTEEAITCDLEEMKAKGYSGALIFDADGSSQQGNNQVPAGPLFAGDEWTKLFVHACKEAKRLGLELSLNIQSGWNLGGPNVTAEEATQQLVWSTTLVEGPERIEQVLETPKHKDFYRDVTVIAVPIPELDANQDVAGQKVNFSVEASSTQKDHVAARAIDGNPYTFWVSNDGPSSDKPQWLLLKLSKLVEISELSLLGRKGYGPRQCNIQVSADGKTFDTVKDFSLKDGVSKKVSFKKQQAGLIRLVFTSAYDSGSTAGKARNVQVAEITLPGVSMPVLSVPTTDHPIKNLAHKNASRELGMSAPDCRYLLETEPALPGEVVINSKGVVNLSARVDKAGMLRWDVPKGKWQILRLGHTNTNAHVSTCSAGWGGRVLDYMNPKSLDAYWGRNIDPLFKAIGPMAGTTVRYIHTDSWEGGGMNWTPGFERTFKENRGYDIGPWLPVLAGYVVDSREDSNAFLADFRKTIGDRVADHYGHLAKLSRKYGMGTHPESAGPHAGPLDGLKNYGRSELMMSEFWSPSPHRPTPDNRFFVKQASSAAHTYGKRLVGAEGFTTIGPHWNDSPSAHMKPSFDHEFCAGLNLLFNHTFTCSPKEMGMPGQEYFAGTHFNPQITWWDQSTAFIDYIRRCQYLAQQGDFVADVVYYYGDHIPNIAKRKGDDPAGALPGYDYDVLSEELLLCMSVERGRLTLPSGMKYRLLVLPDHGVLSLKALNMVDQLVRKGATVLGPKPLKAVSLEEGAEGRKLFKSLSDGLWGEFVADKGMRNVGSGHVAWGMKACELFEAYSVPHDVTFANKEMASTINWIHYRIGDADVYFLSEANGKARSVNAIFRVYGRIPELWDAVDGSIRQANTFKFADGCTQVPLELDEFGSIFVVFREKTGTDRNDGPNFLKWELKQFIAGPWRVTFDPKWGGPTKPVLFKTLTNWAANQDDGIKYYSGKAVYRTAFNAGDDIKGKRLAIELGKVMDVGIASVNLNGADLGIVWRPPFRVDISDAVKTGENYLKVTVVNSWRNRLIGDNKLPEDKRLTRTNIKVRERTANRRQPKWELEESGLLGPVRIMESVSE